MLHVCMWGVGCPPIGLGMKMVRPKLCEREAARLATPKNGEIRFYEVRMG